MGGVQVWVWYARLGSDRKPSQPSSRLRALMTSSACVYECEKSVGGWGTGPIQRLCASLSYPEVLIMFPTSFRASPRKRHTSWSSISPGFAERGGAAHVCLPKYLWAQYVFFKKIFLSALGWFDDINKLKSVHFSFPLHISWIGAHIHYGMNWKRLATEIRMFWCI